MNKYMNEANALAMDNLVNIDGGPFGAVVVCNGVIIGKGKNEVLKTHDPTSHAEILAIREASKFKNSHNLEDCVIYTTCFPCPMCLSAIMWANIKTIYYGNTRADAKEIGFRDDNMYEYFKNMKESDIKFIQIDKEDTIKTFKKFKNIKNKEIY